jgi:hypothetical protein
VLVRVHRHERERTGPPARAGSSLPTERCYRRLTVFEVAALQVAVPTVIFGALDRYFPARSLIRFL